MRRFIGISIFLVLAQPTLRAAEPPRLALRSGDRVVLIGSGLIEQERRFGYLEMRLSRRLAEGSIVFRNLGWAGDTVRGSARTGGYQNPEGFARLLKEVQDYKPTVLFVGYGMNESFEGPAGLPGFREDYAKLLAKLAPLKARIVLLSPTYQEDLGRPFPDPPEHNRDIDSYTAAIQKLADEHKLAFADLRSATTNNKLGESRKRLTTNGLELNEAGSAVAARAVEAQLGLPVRQWSVELDKSGKVVRSDGTRLEEIVAHKDGVRFQATDAMLCAQGDHQILKIDGLPPGKYGLQMDGKLALEASGMQWHKGVSLSDPRLLLDAEILRRAIVVNNGLFYRRWRPFNDHSRHWGYIGGDGKLYDQEMAAQEKSIAELRRPRAHQYEIIRVGNE